MTYVSNEIGSASASELLRALAETHDERPVTVREVTDALGDRSFGLVLMVLALPAWIPVLPPGVPSLFGAAIVAIAAQMIVGRPVPWLPGFAARLSLPSDRFRRLVERAAPWLARVETVCRPRLRSVTGGIPARMIALWIAILALAICVPVPMTNSGPALSIAVIALGLLERDGLIVLGGTMLGLVSLAVSIAFWGGAYLGVRWLIAV